MNMKFLENQPHRHWLPPILLVAFLILFLFSVPFKACAQWVQLNSPYYGCFSLAVMGNNLIANCGGELFRSTDLGVTWLDANNGVEYTSDVTFLYPFGPDVFVLTAFNVGVAISEDTGKSWQERNQPYLNENMVTMISFGDTIIASQSESGMWRSIDTGKHWIMIDTGANGLPILDRSAMSLAASGGYVFQGCDSGGVYRSSDGGGHFKNVLHFPHSRDTIVRCMAAMGSYIFAGVSCLGSDKPFTGYLYRSTDCGETWNVANTGLPYDQSPANFYVLDSTIFVGFDGKVFRSTDSGTTWTNITQGNWMGPAITSGLGYLFVGGNYLFRRPLSDLNGNDFVSPPPEAVEAISVLKIYDLLGRLIYRGPVSSKPLLSVGFYFERTGSTVKKVWVP